MKHSPQENIYEVVNTQEKTRMGLEASFSSSEKIQVELGILDNLVNNDKPISPEDTRYLEDAISTMKVNVEGEEVSVQEFEQMPDMKTNVKIWQEIRQGNFVNLGNLTYLPYNIAVLLKDYNGPFRLDNVKKISDKSIEFLSELKGLISLDGLEFLTDNAAKYLGRHEGILYLDRLVSLSPVQAKYLSGHEGDLILDRLTTISDEAAEYLKYFKHSLHINGVVHISDEAIILLAKRDGGLAVGGLGTVSDVVAEYLGQHKGVLWLNGLRNISEVAAKHLSKNSRIRLSSAVQYQVHKYREK